MKGTHFSKALIQTEKVQINEENYKISANPRLWKWNKHIHCNLVYCVGWWRDLILIYEKYIYINAYTKHTCRNCKMKLISKFNVDWNLMYLEFVPKEKRWMNECS